MPYIELTACESTVQREPAGDRVLTHTNIAIRCIAISVAAMLLAVALTACEPASWVEPGDTPRLIYTETSLLGYRFALENPTRQPIYLRGVKGRGSAAVPVDVAFDCRAQNVGVSTVGGFPLVDGGKDPPFLVVAPGTVMTLAIGPSLMGFKLSDHKGEDCNMRLLWYPKASREGEHMVQSQIFEP